MIHTTLRSAPHSESQSSGKAKSKILFDGNCIVCDIEISHYKRVAPELFELVDISSPEFQASQFKLTKQAVDKDLHVITPEGELKIGVDAFVHIWQQINRYTFLAQMVQLPIIKPSAKLAYALFTKVRPFLPKKK